MVAVIEPEVASKYSQTSIQGLALEPVRNGIGIETMRFGPGRHVIGSSAECSHNLLTTGVQPRHCEIRLEAGHATLRALDFRTWLNNGPVRQAELRQGDRLIVGPLEFRVSLDAGASSLRAPAEDRSSPALPPAAPTTTTASIPTAANPMPSIPTMATPVVSTAAAATPAFIVQALQRSAEMESRLAQLEGKLNERSQDLDSRDRVIAALELDLAQRSARVREQESTSTRRTTALDAQEVSLGQMLAVLETKQHDLDDRLRQAAVARATTINDSSADAVDGKRAEQEAVLEQREALLAQRESALNGRESTLTQRESALNQKELGLAERESSVDARGSALNQRESAFLAREAALRGRDSAIQQRESAFDQRSALLDQRESALTQRISDLGDRAGALDEREAALNERHLAAQQRERDLGGRENAAKSLGQELGDREAQLAERVQKHAARERSLIDREKAAAASEQLQSDLARDLSAREETLRNRSKTLDARESAIDERDRALDERDRMLATRDQSRSEQERSLAEQKQAVQLREQALAEQEQALAHRERSTTGRASESVERERALAARETEIEARQRECEQQTARAREREAELAARSAELDARQDKLRTQDVPSSQGLEELESLRAALETERTEREREREQFQSDKAAAEEALKQAERKARTLEAEYRELAQRQKYLERERENLRRQKEETVLHVRAGGQATAPGSTRPDEAPANPLSPAEQAPVIRTDLRVARTPALPAASAGPARVSTDENPPLHLDDATNKDSVAAYMERLLARTRQPKTDGEVCWIPAPKESASASLNIASASSLSDEPQEISDSQADRKLRSEQTPLPGPSHQQDKATVRADLDSLRNIANSAARSAIANYTSKSLRERILFRTLLLTISFVVAAVLLTSTMWGIGDYVAIGWSAVAACGALGIDILMRSSALRRWQTQGTTNLKRGANTDESETAKTLD